MIRVTCRGQAGHYPGFALAEERPAGAFQRRAQRARRTSMSASQAHITPSTPMGANLIADGATFRVWAPRALHVYVALGGPRVQPTAPTNSSRTRRPATGPASSRAWSTAPSTGSRRRPGRRRLKRDPWARELELDGYPDCDCIVRDPDSLSVARRGLPAAGVQRPGRLPVPRRACSPPATTPGATPAAAGSAKFLDALDRIEYLADLGVNALQPLPLVEFQGEWSLGYNGTDLFSPEMDYVRRPRPTCRRTSSG